MTIWRGACLLLLAALAGSVSAQLTGTYTCANGNPGAAFNYGSIGAFFDALEAQGMSGPVTLNVFDDGGAFASTASYSLGRNNTGTVADVVGLTAANPLVIQAPAGEHPVITGALAPTRFYATDATQVASISFEGVSYVTLDGFEATSTTGTGISAYGDTGSAASPVGPLDNIKIRRCIVHGHPSIGICFYAQAGVNLTDCVIENCFVYDVGGNGALVWGSFVHGAIGIRRPHTTTAIRHTTVLLNNGAATVSSAVHAKGTGGMILENNAFVSATSARPILDLDVLPVLSNYNVLYATNGGTFHTTVANFAAWQTAGQDANGSAADPMMVSATGPGFNLHLQVGSPAIDRAVTSTLNVDIDGDARPIGPARDSGADEVFTGPPPEIEVERAATPVLDGGSHPVGNVSIAGVPFTFTVRNTGVGNLNLTGSPAVVVVPGANCDPTTAVQTQPPLTILTTSQTTTFTVLVDPTAVGAFSLTVSMNTNDPDENPFNFTVTGTAVPANAPAVANPGAGSSFAGPVNGPFTQAVNPAAVLASATISLTDAEANTITVNSITPPATPLNGVTAPIIPAPGQPLTLTWSGTVSALNAPGNYTWAIQFQDSVAGTPVNISVTITVNNLPPAHTPVVGQTGAGTAGNPYLAIYSEGLSGTAIVDLADATDPNAGQAVSIFGTPVKLSGPTGAGFAFNLAASVLRVAPASTLVPADVGVQVWQVTLTDGALNTQVVVQVTINPAPTFVTTTLPDGDQGVAYSQTVTTTGGTGARAIAVLSGSLPAGLTINAAGDISGTPTTAQTANFVLIVTDSLSANTSGAFSIIIDPPPIPPPVISTASPLPDGTRNAAYAAVTFAATGGTTPYTWAMTAGSLPPGMNLSSTGVLGGTPSVTGSFNFTLRVTDTGARTGTKVFDITIDNAPTTSGSSGGGGGGGCAAEEGSGVAMIALLTVLGALIVVGRTRRVQPSGGSGTN